MRRLIIFLILALIMNVSKAQTTSSIGNNEFSFDLFKRVSQTEGNQVISPFSISSALAMTYAGARNETESEISQVMHFDKNQEDFHKDFSALTTDIGTVDYIEGLEYKLANSIWAEKTYKFSKDYFDLLKTNYHSEVNIVPFSSKPEKARTKINKWVAEKTKNKIEELLKKESIDAGTILVLVNALYFHGQWEHKFLKEKTYQGKFKLENGEEVTDFMHQNRKFKYYEDKVLQMVELPYKGERLSMVVILPKTNARIEHFAKAFTYNKYSESLKGLHEAKVDISLPRFKFDSDFELQTTLADMGMKNCFSSAADFSGMTGKKELFIDKVIHQAVIEVNEEGTEAAAATAVIMRKNAAIPHKMIVNRSFMFVIKDNHNGAILFIGKVNNPKSE